MYQILSAVDSTDILRRLLLFHRTVKEISGEDGWVLVTSDASWSYHVSVVNIRSCKPILSHLHWFMQVLVDLLFYPFADSYSIIILRFISYLIQFEPSLFPFSDRSPPTLARRGACTATPWCQAVASVPREMKKWRALEQRTKNTCLLLLLALKFILPETNSSPPRIGRAPKGSSSSNHWFPGAIC